MTVSPKHQVEALLFSSGKTMTSEQLAELSKLDKAKVTRALKALQKDYSERDSAIELINDPTGWKMTVRNEHLALVKNIVAETELSRACMETLAVIAFKYPKVLQSEVVETRGSGAYEHIHELERLGFVNKSRDGRSYALKLTEKFFEYFDVHGEKDIRKVFKEVKVPKRKVGDLDVVVVPGEKHEDKGPVGDLDVVDVPEEPFIPEIIKKELETPEERGKHMEFLNDLDEKIAALTEKNDERDEDPAYKRRVPEMGEDTPDEEPEE